MDLASVIAAFAAIPGIGPYMVYISFVLTVGITIASILATMLPAPIDINSRYAVVYRVVNFVALSFGHARSLSAPESKGIVGGPGAIVNPMVAIAVRPASSPDAPATVLSSSRLSMAFVLMPLLLISACAAPNAAVTATAPVLSRITTDVATALRLYGIVKGEAQVAALASPNLAPFVATAIAKADPIAAALQSGTPAAEGIAASAAVLVDQAVALETATAHAVKVVPAATAQ